MGLTLCCATVTAGVWLFPGVGDAKREHRSAQRLQVHRSQRLQRRHYVRRWRPCLTARWRQTGLDLPHHRAVRRFQHDDNCLSRLRTQGAFCLNCSYLASQRFQFHDVCFMIYKLMKSLNRCMKPKDWF